MYADVEGEGANANSSAVSRPGILYMGARGAPEPQLRRP